MIKKLSLILVLVLMLSLSLIGCEPEYIGDGSSIYDNIEISDFKNNRTDKQPLLDVFDKIIFESCLWQSGFNYIGFKDVGATNWYRGYLLLSPSYYESIMLEYSWETQEYDFFGEMEPFLFDGSDIPALDLKSVNLKKSKLVYSSSFNGAKMNKDYYGAFYLDLNNNALYFDVDIPD